MKNTKEKFDLVYASTQSLRDAKRETIHFMGRVGRRFKKLRYPIFLFTVLFVFIYNVFLYAFIALRVKDKMARALALAMTAILVLTSIDITAFAMSSKLELKETSVIVGFKELEEDIRIQKLTVGDTEDGIRFPKTLTATIMIEQHNDEMEQIDNPAPEFSTIPVTETEEVSDVQESITSEQDETFGAEDTLNEEESVTPEPEETRDTDETENLEPEEQGGDTPEEIPNETENQQENEGEPEPEVETETDSEPEPEENLVSRVTDFLFPAMTVYAAEETPLIEETEIGESEIAVSWVLEADRSSREVFSSEQEGDAFVYVPVFPDGYCIAEDVSVPEILVMIENKEQSSSDAFSQSMTLDGIEISVYAPAGVFPAGAFLDVKMITNEAEVSEIERLVSEKKDATTSPDVTTVVEQSYSFDIAIRDENGTEIEPDTTKGQVSVTFKNVGVIETEQQEDKELSVFYVSDDYQEAEELSHDTDIDEDSASIMAEHFSIYTVVITTETNVILPYYQGTSKAASYFTVYNEEQLIRYRDLLNDYIAGTVTNDNKIATILVNADDANPMDGITGLGQATNMTVADLNFSVKIMDNITVNSEWKPINKIPLGVTFNGGGHTITFERLAVGVTFSTESPTVLVTTNEGSVINVTLRHENQIFTVDGEEEEDFYATVTVRVDGKKAEIGEAITGAEALAASCDGINYITLKRSDDLSVYRTELENLEEDKEYNVYYVYEDENETISAATITKEKPKAELNYVSVKYDLEGANTYSYIDNDGDNVYTVGSDGELSEDVMAAVRVDVGSDGCYHAQEDYRAVVKAAEGFEIPELKENVKVSYLNGSELIRDTDFSYVYDQNNKLGSIWIKRKKITGPLQIEVHADKLEQKEYATIILKTKGGVIANPVWEKSADEEYTYEQKVYKGTNVTLKLPNAAEISNINGSTAIAFEGWYYNDINCSSQSKVSGSGIQTSSLEMGSKYVYYAKYTIAKQSDNNDNMWYSYAKGTTDVRGYNKSKNEYIRTTFSDAGFAAYCKSGSLPTAGTKKDYSGTHMLFPTSGDIFTSSSINSKVYIAEVYTLDGNYVNVTYIFENRGNSAVTNFNFGLGADVKISTDDTAEIAINTEGTAKYLSMSAEDGNVFKAYIKGEQLGVDEVSRYWYGCYEGSKTYNGLGWNGNVFNNGADKNYTTTQDSALAFCWSIPSIPANGIVTRSIKIGIGNAFTMGSLSATFRGGIGKFVSGSKTEDYKTVTSNSKQIEVLADGRIKVNGTTIIDVPVNTYGYDFAYWSYTNRSYDDSPAPEKFTGRIQADSTLYAIWVPHPSYSVKNNSSVQKVNGSDSLLVPEQLGSIVIENQTPGTEDADGKHQIIGQGAEVEEAAGNASDFTAVLSLKGEDDRYLLPDDIKITVKKDGNDIELSKGTGYTYEVYNNRKNAALRIYKQYITGTITITAVGYELPPVTATSVSVTVSSDTISYGDRAVFTAHADTSKNHVASYQWYVAPYYYNTLDKVYWTYQNQDGTALQNGTFHRGDTVYDRLYGTIKAESDTHFVPSGNPIMISGANKATLRIAGLDVNTFSNVTPGESMDGLRYGGYHVYCKVTSTRNITGQEIVAVSDTTELQVVTAQYSAPDGIEGSATTYYGSPDGTIAIAPQENRPKLLYKKSTDTTWKQVTAAQIEAGEITELTAGTYEFKYAADSNHTESSITRVVVENGRYIVVTYRAAGCDDAALRTQYKHVVYGSNVTAATPGLSANDVAITGPTRTGYTFAGWDRETISNITSDTTVNAVYTYGVYKVTLDNQGASNAGTAAIYEKYSAGFYQDSTCTTPVTGAKGITIPVRDGYNFLGYYTSAKGGTRMLNADGCLSENITASMYLANGTLYAHWEEKPVDFNVVPGVDNPSGGTSGGDTPGSDPENDVEISVKPSEPVDPDNPGTGEEDPRYHVDTSYDVTVTNNTGVVANVIYIYSDGVLKKTITNVIFDENNQYTFALIPGEVGGGTITFAVGYVSPVTDEDTEKTDEELKEEAEQQAADLNYTITYKEVNGTLIGTDFSGTFLSTASVKGVKGVATALPRATKTGYTFAGWYMAPRGTGRAITEIAASNTSDEVTVYAKWIANKYTITLRTNGGTYSDGYTPAEQYQHDSNNIELPDDTQISKENYVFLGWFDNAELTGDAIREVDASKVGVVTYYAGWELLSSHMVTLAEDGMDGQQYVLSGTEGYGFVKDGIIYVYDGKSYQFTVTVSSAYKLKAVKANGKLLTGTNGVYTIPSVTDDIIITVTTEQLVATDTLENVAATICLFDGTTGYFKTIADAINYAANYGTNSVIQLQKNFSNVEIDAKAGTASYSIDLNGYTVDGGSTLLIEDGAVVALKDSVFNSLNEANELSIENRGTFTNDIIVAYLLNLGITNNNGKVLSMTQQDSEHYEKSKFVNNGTVESTNLEHGYFVENVQEGAPAGLTGYTTIMNGNEYYVAFADAVDIANASASDATILILSTVDNRNSTIEISNQNGNAITVDLNSYNISGGELIIGGKTSFINGKGSATCISEITASIDNTGELTIGEYVKVAGVLVNEEGGKTKVEEKAAVSGPVTNKGDLENDGDITGVYTNESGHTRNSETGTMNNVIQKGGDFDNDGEIKTKLELEGGSYIPTEGATPGGPEGAVAKSNTNPVTYYGTFRDAVEDANNPETSGAEGQEQPFTITLIKDVSDDDMGEAPIVLDPDVPININLNNHKLGDENSDKQIQIGNSDGGESAGKTVTIQNQPESGETADSAKGNVNSPMKVEDGDSLDVDKDVSLDDVYNDGKLKVEEGGIVEKLINQGDTENDGTLRVTTQNGGNLKNGETGQIDQLTQNGGNTENQGIITKADMSGGGYTGTDPKTITGVEPSDETDGKVAKITPSGGGDPIYFVSLDDALEYAAGMDNGPVTVELLKDVTDENINFTTTKTPVNLDLKGHSIKPSSTITTGTGTDLTITDSLDGEKGKVEVSVTNNGRLANESEITGSVTNNGDFDNKGKVTGDVAQKGGTYTNEDGATTKKIIQTGGETINKDTPDDDNGGIEAVDLQRGSYEGAEPTSGIESDAKIGDKLYGDLESAIEDANEADNEVTIELTKKVELPDTPPLVIDNENGHNINIDLKGNDITGGELQIGSGDSESGDSPSGKVTFTDSSTLGEKGTIGSDIKVKTDGDLTLGKDVTTFGNVGNAGKISNNGIMKAPGTVTNTGDMENNGDIETKVEQKKGTFTNGEDGKVSEVEQTGGTLDNKNPNGIENATVSDGEFKGDPATNMNYEGAKVAVITQNPDGTTKTTYYSSIEEAINNTDGNVILQLIDDVKDESSEDILINKPGITLDLNGHEIGAPSKLTISENATDTKITDSSEDGNGKVTAPVDNKGDLTIDNDVKAADVTNSGTLNNKGEITTLTNKGDATNSGTIGTLKQESGNMQNDRTIQSVEFTGGGYEGKDPETPIDNPLAKIGDKLYADLESAIEDANKSSEDVTIKVLQNTTLPKTSIGNESGKKITLDLNGKNVAGGPLTVKAPGVTEITDSSEQGEGSLEPSVQVDAGAKLVIDGPANVCGDIENQGTTENHGHAAGDVTNKSGGNIVNDGDIAGNVKNEAGGNFTNRGENSHVGGKVENAGHMSNEGVIGGEVDNTGNLDNNGNIDNNVTNRGNGKLDNDGKVNGQLENKENATTDNSGYINQVKQTGGEVTNSGEIPEYLQNGGDLTNSAGGTIQEITQNGGELTNSAGGIINQLTQTGGHTENAGTIDTVETSDIKNFNGNKPSEGLPEAKASVTYIDENGKEKTEYYTTFDEAMEKAGEGNPDGTTPTKITLVTSPFVVDEELTIPDGVTLEVPEGNTLKITETGKLINRGTIQVDTGANLEIEQGGSLTNQSTMVNNGTLENAGELKNESQGTIKNAGDISNTETGEFTNEGKIDNKNGSLNGSDYSAGNIINNGSITGGTVSGPLENGTTGVISGSDKLQGQIKNEGKIEVSSGQVSAGADIENLPGSSFVNIEEMKNQNNKPGDSQADGDSSDEESSDNDTTEETVAVIKKPLVLPLQISETEESSGQSAGTNTFNRLNRPERDNTESEAPAGTTEIVQNATSEENAAEQKAKAELEDKPIMIHNLDEAEGIVIVKNQVVLFGKGTVEFEVESTDSNVKADLKMLLQSCFTEEELERIEKGENAVTRVSVVKVAETVSPQDKKVVEEQLHILEETIKGLQFGQYIEIYVECKIGDSEWRQVHELSGDMTLEITVPDELLKNERTYYVLRNHEGACDLLEDLDDEPTTVTIATNRFSTYALLYVDNDTAEESMMGWVWFLVGGSVLLLFLIFLFLKRKKEEEERA